MLNDGTYNCICPRCGFKKNSAEIRQEWTGLYVCEPCWDPRHPLDFFQVKAEDNTLPFSLPDGTHAEEDTSAWQSTLTDYRGTPT